MDISSFSIFLENLSRISGIDYLVLDREGIVFPAGNTTWDTGLVFEFSAALMDHGMFGYTELKQNSLAYHVYGHPLQQQDKTIGSLIAIKKTAFDNPDVSADKAVMETFLTAVASIINDKWTSDLEAEDYARELAKNFEETYLYSKISTHMKSIGSSTAMFGEIIEELFKTTEVDFAFSLMPEYPQNNQILLSDPGSEHIQDPDAFLDSLMNSIPMEENSIDQMFFIVNDSANDPVYIKKHPLPFRFLAVMIKRKNTFYGWLGFLSFNVSKIFVNSELKLLKSVAASAAVSMENSNLYAQSIITAQKEGELRRKFQKYVPEMVVEEILRRDVKDIISMGESRYLTLLNVDIRGYSKMSKRITSAEVVVVINYFFKIMGKIVLKHKGTIDKYLGDGLLAIFGAPVKTPHPELDATLAAMDMVESLKDVNNFIHSYGVPINIGVSVHAGEAIVGNIGFENKMEYTVIGDMVNDTFRLQEITKEKMNSIMISNAVYQKIAPYCRVRSLGERLLGENESRMEVFEVVGRRHLQN